MSYQGVGQRLVPNDNSTQPGLNDVQSTTWDTSTYGNPTRDLPEVKVIQLKSLKSQLLRSVKTQPKQGPV